MKEQNRQHLQEEQIIWAVIDEMELGEPDRHHLVECRNCRQMVEQFREELHDFGENARLSVPPFSRAVKLPAEKPVQKAQKVGWLPFYGAAAMAGLVVFFYVMGMGSFSPIRMAVMQDQGLFLEDEIFMQKISEMVENPFPDDMYEITGDNGFGFDEEFLEFIIPEVQEDFQSEVTNPGGVKQC